MYSPGGRVSPGTSFAARYSMSIRHITHGSQETPNSFITSGTFGYWTGTPSLIQLIRCWIAGTHMPTWYSMNELGAPTEKLPELTPVSAPPTWMLNGSPNSLQAS